MTGVAALILLLTGFQVALLLARNIMTEADREAGPSVADTVDMSPECFTPIPINLNRADSLSLLDIPGIGPY